MILSVVEAAPASSKPSAADDSIRTSAGGRYGFGASAPSLTRALLMHFSGAERGSAILPKLVKLVGPSYSRASIDLLQRPPYAFEFSCLFLRLPPWQDVTAELDAAVLLDAGLFFISLPQVLTNTSPFY